MSQPAPMIKEGLLKACLSWFQVDFRQNIVSLIEGQFPGLSLPAEVQSILERWDQIQASIPSGTVNVAALFEKVHARDEESSALLKQIFLRYRRFCAARSEGLREKTFHAGITQTVNEDIDCLDAVVETDWFQAI
jgi:hypothetical protein